ncbi:MAG: hypothetical protein Q8K65_04770 [Alphaproteobacteria bacterium]|nr:hypothetical protein [Alphaproteobacteria bacterium]
MTENQITPHTSAIEDRLWAAFAGAIAGSGSALGAIVFAYMIVDEAGIAGAILCGTISAALAIPVARRKVKQTRPFAAAAGFFAPIVAVVLIFL